MMRDKVCSAPEAGAVVGLFRDAVGVAGQVVEDVFGSTERWLGVDDPVLRKELPLETLKAFRCSEFLE